MGLKISDRLRGWSPIRFFWKDGQPLVDWCLTDDVRFTDPFFEQTITRAMQDPFRVLFRHQTPIEALGELEAESPVAAPTGFIYHMSRCGSTLVAQMLAALPDSLVISEAGPIDAVLQANRKNPLVTDKQRIDWLRWMIGALGRRPDGKGKRFFVKLDCWQTVEMDLIRQAFPTTPWIFVYRDPVEVMVSQFRQPAYWTLPGILDPARFGIDPLSVPRTSREQFCGQVLQATLQAALDRYRKDGGFLVAYPNLPDVVWNSVGKFFGLTFSSQEIELMKCATELDAKNPYYAFVADSAAKQKEASEAIRKVCGELLYPLYERLEESRVDQQP
jgi:hypothetical protein